jgi:orotidine-5'-phosphate decarboxylase
MKIPAHLRTKKNGVLEFNKRIIDATKDIVCAYKINFAFYETLGAEGWAIIEKTRSIIPSSILTIADAKRGDIGNSSGYYADAILNRLDFDSITVAPYMGIDSVQPFLHNEKRGVFLLALTSNSGAYDFQYAKVGKRRLFEEVVVTSQQWTDKNNLGFVVGATKSKDIASVRRLAPNAPLLVPGIGAQGGSINDVVTYGCTKDGYGVLINASRSILYASSGKDFATAARAESERLNTEVNNARNQFT